MSVEFELYGLNPRQMILADIIWACETKDKVNAFIRSLPTKELRNEAQSIVDLMVLAVVEQCYDGITDNMAEADQLIRKISK
jgi:hypothetical protein